MTASLIPETVRKLLSSQPIELPVFHPVALKLQRMLTEYDFTIDDISSVATEDQALASQMLKMANSPMYMGRTRVATIKEAVIRLGAQQVINLAIAASQATMHESQHEALDNYMKKMWEHSYGAAFGARWLAFTCGMRGVVDETYLAALLHDVGKLYLLKSIERLVDAGVITSLYDTDLIMDVFDAMHVEKGYQLMHHWNFPNMYCDVVRDHHIEQWDTVNKMLAIVRFVNLTCRRVGLGMKHDPDIDLLATTEAQALGLEEQQVQDLESVLLSSRDMMY